MGERKKAGWPWIIGIMSLPLLYFISTGPIVGLLYHMHMPKPVSSVLFAYLAPIDFVADKSRFVQKINIKYVMLFVDQSNHKRPANP